MKQKSYEKKPCAGGVKSLTCAVRLNAFSGMCTLLIVLSLGSCKISRRTTKIQDCEQIRTQTEQFAGRNNFLQNDSAYQSDQWNIRLSDTLTWIVSGTEPVATIFSRRLPQPIPDRGIASSSASFSEPVRYTAIRHATLAANAVKQSTTGSRTEKNAENFLLRTDTVRLHSTETGESTRAGAGGGRWFHSSFSLLLLFAIILVLAIHWIKRK